MCTCVFVAVDRARGIASYKYPRENVNRRIIYHVTSGDSKNEFRNLMYSGCGDVYIRYNGEYARVYGT